MKPLSDVPEDLDEDSDAQSTTTVSDNHDGPVSPTDGGTYRVFCGYLVLQVWKTR